jgi:hypothetical protein
MRRRPADRSWSVWLLANAAVLALVATFAWLDRFDADRFYQAVQEDERLEWASVAGFLLAAGASLAAARRQRAAGRRLPWFPLGIAMFCFVVAMEEISWGQRLLGFRPATYFLEHNFQQETNVHNVVDTKLRLLAMRIVIAGYGIALPLLGALPALRRLLERLGIVAPPAALVPAFAATLALHLLYPWQFSDEIVEAMLGLCVLFAAMAAARPAPRLAAAALALVLVAGLGEAGAALSRQRRSESPETLAAARAELAALADDLLARTSESRGRLPTPCGLHKRVYTFVRDYDAAFLSEGTFTKRVEGGLPEQRAAFFLDPWNSPYWIRDHCDSEIGERIVFFYSFGPDRRRSSSEREIGGDDVAHFVRKVRGRGAPSGPERPPDESRESPR